MSEEMKAWVAWNPGAKINVRLVHGWEEEMWAYQLNLSGEHHPTTIVAMELPLASRTPSANREVVEAKEWEAATGVLRSFLVARGAPAGIREDDARKVVQEIVALSPLDREVVERVARALCLEDGRDPDEITTHKPPPDEDEFEKDVPHEYVEGGEFYYFDDEVDDRMYAWKRWRSYVYLAQAALSAIGE